MDNITIFVSNHISNHDLKINEYYERTFDPKIFKKIKFAISNEWKNLVYNLIFDDTLIFSCWLQVIHYDCH